MSSAILSDKHLNPGQHYFMSKKINTEDPNWEKEAVRELAWNSLKEQRRTRRWGIFFKLLTFLYLGVVLYMMLDLPGIPGRETVVGKDHTALIRLKGLIADGTSASAQKINKLLETAFTDKHTKGVILEINSPGGTPVEASSIYDKIRELRKKHPDIKLYAVARDLCASGGYYVASAADEIHANKSSIVGSIGVRMDSFGVQDAMKKLGIENRTITAGKNKALLDPFQPQDPAQRAHLQTMLNQVHQQFISAVKAGRGDRLKETDDIFSGLIWSGEAALDLGLVDGFESSENIAKNLIGEENIVILEPKKSLLMQLTEGVGEVSAQVIQKLIVENAAKGQLN